MFRGFGQNWNILKGIDWIHCPRPQLISHPPLCRLPRRFRVSLTAEAVLTYDHCLEVTANVRVTRRQ